MSVARELARELPTAGYLVCCVEDLRVPFEDAVPILVNYLGQRELPLGLAVCIGNLFWNFPAAWGSAACVALLRAYARHRNAPAEPRFRIAEGIARMATSKDLTDIVRLPKDRGQVVADDEPYSYSPRYALAEALPRLMGRRALDLWRELLDDPEEGLRVLAIAGLCRLNDRESLPQLREAVRDVRHAGRRRKIADALAKLTKSAPA
ncbi:MAG: HEAT repeat domain-containing protein [Chromatiales bacterium]|jgi:hypothetical protein|nr:HEAT repeat domain-containing protein [Chromatiales bacterium]